MRIAVRERLTGRRPLRRQARALNGSSTASSAASTDRVDVRASAGAARAVSRRQLAGRSAKLGADWHSDTTTDVRYDNLAMLLYRRRIKKGEAARLLFALQRHYARRLLGRSGRRRAQRWRAC
jgi:hypothetical protein